jgi:UDPglucose--hexose-1-phosphate uridylyltransferase
MADLRRNRVTGDWVIVAAGREARPRQFAARNNVREAPDWDADCPLCPGNEGQTPTSLLELPGLAGEAWQVRVVANKYSALTPESGESGGKAVTEWAAGSQEVVVETRIHNASPYDFDQARVEMGLAAIRDRYRALMSSPSVQYVLPFKNHGASSGASLVHAHSQIAALTFVPRQVARRVRLAEAGLAQRDGCPVCRLAAEEMDSGARIVSTSASFVIVEPFASSYAAETWIVPLAHQASFAELDDVQLGLLAGSLRRSLRSVGAVYEEPAFNYVIHSSPRDTGIADGLHWFLQLIPRLSVPGGFEFGTATMINGVPPEQAAIALREAWQRDAEA